MEYWNLWAPGNGFTAGQYLKIKKLGITLGHVYIDYGCGYDYCFRTDKDIKALEVALKAIEPRIIITKTNSFSKNSWGELISSVLNKAEAETFKRG